MPDEVEDSRITAHFDMVNMFSDFSRSVSAVTNIVVERPQQRSVILNNGHTQKKDVTEKHKAIAVHSKKKHDLEQWG